MLVFLTAALLQATSPPPAQSQRDIQRARRDSTRNVRRDHPKEVKRIAVTPELLATAFKDTVAEHLLRIARAARLRFDNSLQSYDATTYQRVSAGLGFSHIGRDRLAFRSEEATKVRWRRGVGAYVDVTGARTVVPIAGQSGAVHFDGDISPIPYFPGSETLWIGSEAMQGTVNENDGVIHPIADGSEAYYTYAAGDSAVYRLPGGESIHLRELQVRPRSPKWNLAVGSLWFDLSSGQLVRAAYRMSVPMDIRAVAEEDDSTSFEDVPALVKPMIFPMTASISAIGVEYGLYQGRFWLPRVQVLEGGANMSFVKVPFKLEQKFEYEHVNAGDSLPAIPLPPGPANRRNNGTGLQVAVTVGPTSRADSIAEVKARRASRRAPCEKEPNGNYTYTRSPRDNPNPILITIPCDSAKLFNSPDLPKSIYDAGEETFSSAEMDDLVKSALSMGAQANFSPLPMTVEYVNFRYNRVEGLSGGGRADQQLGAGYSIHALGRIGIADLEPNVEVSAARSDLRRTYTITGYNRLVSASDWGNPLSLSASISALLFGRDEGFYYRASGLELSSTPDAVAGGAFVWSAFVEQERNAKQNTTFSLAHAFKGSEFEPNVIAHRAGYAGVRARYTATYGLDPQGFRLFSDWRAEGAASDTGTYGRFAVDMTASHSLGRSMLGALTLAGGTSTGTLPTQRYWFLGGTQTVRGERPGIEAGNAFWLARSELALGNGVIRPTLFGDLGWAGDRDGWKKIGLPMSGAGIGWSMMDGLVRFDVARGIHPFGAWRVDTYIEARF